MYGIDFRFAKLCLILIQIFLHCSALESSVTIIKMGTHIWLPDLNLILNSVECRVWSENNRVSQTAQVRSANLLLSPPPGISYLRFFFPWILHWYYRGASLNFVERWVVLTFAFWVGTGEEHRVYWEPPGARENIHLWQQFFRLKNPTISIMFKCHNLLS